MEHLATERPSVALVPSGTRHLSDAEFLAAFESCTLAGDAFRHYDHVRLAWVYLEHHALDEATARMADAIRHFALHHTGSTAKYDDAVTRSWMHLVDRARATCVAADFAAFAAANPMLFDRRRAFALYGAGAR